MADVNTQSCDVCGALKKESNNWYRARVSDGRFLLTHWSDILATKHLHLCGIGCASKFMAHVMLASACNAEGVPLASREDLDAVGYTGI